MADLLFPPSAMPEAADMTMIYAGMKMDKLPELMMSTLLGEEGLKPEKICRLCNLNFNYVLDKLDLHDCDGGVRRYSSTMQLLANYLESNGNVTYTIARAEIYFWLGWLAAALE